MKSTILCLACLLCLAIPAAGEENQDPCDFGILSWLCGPGEGGGSGGGSGGSCTVGSTQSTLYAGTCYYPDGNGGEYAMTQVWTVYWECVNGPAGTGWIAVSDNRPPECE